MLALSLGASISSFLSLSRRSCSAESAHFLLSRYSQLVSSCFVMAKVLPMARKQLGDAMIRLCLFSKVRSYFLPDPLASKPIQIHQPKRKERLISEYIHAFHTVESRISPIWYNHRLRLNSPHDVYTSEQILSGQMRMSKTDTFIHICP